MIKKIMEISTYHFKFSKLTNVQINIQYSIELSTNINVVKISPAKKKQPIATDLKFVR